MTNNEVKQFIADRNEAVWSLDADKFKAFLKKYQVLGIYKKEMVEVNLRMSDKFIRGEMAKMCFNITTTPRKVLKQADIILKELGWDRYIL